MDKLVYFFGEGKADGNTGMKDLLGGKGANLAEMTNLGIPVPPGFTISTRACNLYFANKHKMPKELSWPNRLQRPTRVGKRTFTC